MNKLEGKTLDRILNEIESNRPVVEFERLHIVRDDLYNNDMLYVAKGTVVSERQSENISRLYDTGKLKTQGEKIVYDGLYDEM